MPSQIIVHYVCDFYSFALLILLIKEYYLSCWPQHGSDARPKGGPKLGDNLPVLPFLPPH